MENIAIYKKILNDLNMGFSKFTHIEKRSVDKHINDKKIGFYFFREKDERRNEVVIHIVIKRDSSSIETVNYINENYKDIFKIRNEIYISRKLKDKSATFIKIKRILPKSSVHLISDLIKRLSQNSMTFTKDPYDIFKFVYPTIISQDQKELLANEVFFDQWYNSEVPILVLTGKGGIGKTTVAKYCSNHIIYKIDNSISNIFINSVDIKSRLIEENKHKSSLNIYDIYKASIKTQNILSEAYFNYNLKFNNFFIVIDGIDELISKVDNFNIEVFIDSIYNQSLYSKIIITCRTEYWEVKRDYITLSELKPFDENQMNSFFNSCFGGEKSKIKEAIEHSNDFHFNKEVSDGTNIYSPYVLDLVYRIVNEKIHLVDSLETTRLNWSKKTRTAGAGANDYIIAKMCYREIFLEGRERILPITIDEQVKIFEYIAIVFNRPITLEELKIATLFGINKNTEKEQDFNPIRLTDSFKSHPLLKVNEDDKTIYFYYDLFSDIFKCTYIAYNFNNLNIEEIIDDVKYEFLDFLSLITFESNLSIDIKKRIKKWDNNHYKTFNDLIEDSNYPKEKKTLMFAGLFNLSFEINKKFNSKNLINSKENTIFLKSIFVKNNRISNLCLINIEDKLVFDFSSIIIFENCYFNKWTSFWDEKNKWHPNVQFLNCEFKNLGLRYSKKILNWNINNEYTYFDFNSQQKMDREFKEQFLKNRVDSENLKDEINIFVRNFVKSFWSKSRFHPTNFDKKDAPHRIPFIDQYKEFCNIQLKFEDFISICREIEIINIYDYELAPLKKIELKKEVRAELTKFYQDNIPVSHIQTLKSKIYNRIK